MTKSTLISITFSILGLFVGIGIGMLTIHRLSFFSTTTTKPKKPQIIGFLPYWLIDKADKDYSDTLTQLSYFGLGINPDGTLTKLVTPQEEEPGWTTLKSEKLSTKLNGAKEKGIEKSLLVRNMNEDQIIQLLQNPTESAKNLITDITPIMRDYGFTNLNVDIESFAEASPEQQQSFTLFIKELKTGMVQNNLGTLTIDVSPSALIKPFLIDVKEISIHVDYIVFMTYDYHYIGSYIAGPVAPVGGKGEVREFDVETGIQEALNVVPREKIILGIPLYGYGWETISSKPGAPVIPGGATTASNRRITSEILLACETCVTGVDPWAQQPYLIQKNIPNGPYTQIFYEDKTSLQKKVELAKKYRIGGVALWALGYDGQDLLEPLKDYKTTPID